LWYHPHPHGSTARHVYRGLAGMFIIDDESSGSFGLPAEYGVNDIPVIVQDVAFDGDGQLDRRRRWFNQVGFLGDTILVNGTIAPYIEVVDDRIRLRLLNASTARVYDFGFSDDRPFLLVATDGGLLPAPYETTRTMLSPGERAEIVVTLDPSTRAVLRSYPPSLGSDFANNRFSGGSDSFDIVELRAATELRASPEVPTHLVEVPSVNSSEAVQIRRFDVTTRAINGQDMDMGRIDAVVDAGTVEIWEVTGISVPHNFHVHGVQFQVLDIDGSPPPPPLQGWKDTVYLMPDVTTRIIITFPDEADPKRPYMYHCHLLRHEDRGAMGQFVIVGPGSGAKR
jgi:FtsP/CotA-like multicopper oxidase with cupredoxin domain